MTRQASQNAGGWTREGPTGQARLTRREEEVLRLVAHGLSNAEIAAHLFISEPTAKIQVTTRAHAFLHGLAP